MVKPASVVGPGVIVIPVSGVGVTKTAVLTGVAVFSGVFVGGSGVTLGVLLGGAVGKVGSS
jgi:hypothetical protein